MSNQYDSFEWDEAKSERNRLLRGFGFAYASRVFLDRYVEEESQGDFDERRFVATGRVDEIIITVVWTPRDAARRIISAWRASRRERRRYYGHNS
jgi:uncharacterized DUF497 family protein